MPRDAACVVSSDARSACAVVLAAAVVACVAVRREIARDAALLDRKREFFAKVAFVYVVCSFEWVDGGEHEGVLFATGRPTLSQGKARVRNPRRQRKLLVLARLV